MNKQIENCCSFQSFRRTGNQTNLLGSSSSLLLAYLSWLLAMIFCMMLSSDSLSLMVTLPSTQKHQSNASQVGTMEMCWTVVNQKQDFLLLLHYFTIPNAYTVDENVSCHPGLVIALIIHWQVLTFFLNILGVEIFRLWEVIFYCITYVGCDHHSYSFFWKFVSFTNFNFNILSSVKLDKTCSNELLTSLCLIDQISSNLTSKKIVSLNHRTFYEYSLLKLWLKPL